jgi:hypothetical protein
MSTDDSTPATPKAMVWTGRVISGLVVAMLTFSAAMKLAGPEEVAKEFDRLGYSQQIAVPLGIVELGCAAVYAVPQTSVLGAILLTGYLGGATATHVRVDDPFISPVIGGVLVWLGLFLRDARLRRLIPLKL